MLRKRDIFGQIVSGKIQYSEEKWDDPDPLGDFRVLLFKICRFQGSFLVDFEIGHCENRLTLAIVCA